MNLTTPPPVEKLARAEELRADLVRHARQSQRSRPAWVPVLAAACGIAVITTGVVALTRTGDEGSGPSSTPSTSSTPAEIVPEPTTNVKKVPADQSPRKSLDLGPATNAEAVAAARSCLAQKGSHDGQPNLVSPTAADAVAARQARWIKVTSGQASQVPVKGGRILVQTFTTAKGDWVQCVGGELMRSYPSGWGGLSRERALSVDSLTPVNGQWSFAQVGASTQVLMVDYSFVTMPNVARLELRIRYTRGAGPWYGVPVLDGAGYISASQLGVSGDDEHEFDYRAFDKNGKQVYTGIEYG